MSTFCRSVLEPVSCSRHMLVLCRAGQKNCALQLQLLLTSELLSLAQTIDLKKPSVFRLEFGSRSHIVRNISNEKIRGKCSANWLNSSGSTVAHLVLLQ